MVEDKISFSWHHFYCKRCKKVFELNGVFDHLVDKKRIPELMTLQRRLLEMGKMLEEESKEEKK